MLSLVRKLYRLCGWGSRGPEHTDKPVAEESGPDDLTAIRGIGIASQNRLYAAGIKTYAQLAAATPEGLRNILGKTGQGAKVGDWIVQARDLAGDN